ncbi:MAG: acyltransferase family protein [Rothia sp. (in: high G+C Gram-positive bacteria)]|nr:acyltransferase family protein [Rothia sp. (in: high G+C Gram-positive bacteria)]
MSRSPLPTPPKIRKDIQFLRAIAVLLVVFNHLRPQTFTGGYIGVDIFFVISGFLISSHLLRELNQSGSIRFSRFYARRARRLLPAALFVAVITMINTLLFMPSGNWSRASQEFFASSAYFQNWKLLFTATDYFAKDTGETGFQHYWSLSVEEQFYLVWPLILTALFIFSARLSKILRGNQHFQRLLIALAIFLLLVISLGFAQHLVNENSPTAYFHTLARVWEFMIGALIAVLGETFSKRLAELTATGWQLARNGLQLLGYFLLLIAGILFSSTSGVPGKITVIPLIGVSLVIATGSTTYIPWLRQIVEFKAFQFIGDISYSLYLWHWPLIVVLPFVFEQRLSWWQSALILPLALVLATITKFTIEDHFRLGRAHTIKPKMVLSLTLASVLVLGITSLGINAYTAHTLQVEKDKLQADLSVATNDSNDSADEKVSCFGALSIKNRDKCTNQIDQPPIISAGVDSETPWGDNPQECKTLKEEELSSGGALVHLNCDYSQSENSPNIWLIGDSHAEQWKHTILPIAQKNHWKLTILTHSGCPTWNISMTQWNVWPRVSPVPSSLIDSCKEWSKEIIPQVTQNKPDVVLIGNYASTQGVSDSQSSSQTQIYRGGIQEGTKDWVASGSKVIVIRDTPTAGTFIGPDCVKVSGEKCTFDETSVLFEDPQFAAAQELGISVIDMSDYFCPEQICKGVIGGVPVFYDTNHMSRSFAQSLVVPFQEKMEPIVATIRNQQ